MIKIEKVSKTIRIRKTKKRKKGQIKKNNQTRCIAQMRGNDFRLAACTYVCDDTTATSVESLNINCEFVIYRSSSEIMAEKIDCRLKDKKHV